MRGAFFRAGSVMALFAVAANGPYAYLIVHFGYDDVLREPAADVLAKYQAGGDGLVFAWLAFTLVALSFVLVAGFVADALREADAKLASFATAAGMLSALAQAIGLSRWVFVAPVLADMAAAEETRSAALVAYQVLHQFAGVAIGEHVGQTLLATWTAGLSWTILRNRLAPALLGWLGFLIAAAWLIGQTELLATVTDTPVIEITPFAFVGWQVWLLALGLVWMLRSPTAAAATTTAAAR